MTDLERQIDKDIWNFEPDRQQKETERERERERSRDKKRDKERQKEGQHAAVKKNVDLFGG